MQRLPSAVNEKVKKSHLQEPDLDNGNVKAVEKVEAPVQRKSSSNREGTWYGTSASGVGEMTRQVQSVQISACSRWDACYTATSCQTSLNQTRLFWPAVRDCVVMKSSSKTRTGDKLGWRKTKTGIRPSFLNHRHVEQAQKFNEPKGYRLSLTHWLHIQVISTLIG